MPIQRKICDLKIFLDTQEELRKLWKIKRDTQNRGYSIEEVLSQIKSRSKDSLMHIIPQKKFANVIINFFSLNSFSFQDVNANPNIGMKISIPADLNLDFLITRLPNVKWDYNEDLITQSLTFENEPKIDVKNTIKNSIKNYDEIISSNPIFSNGYYGIIQIILVYLIAQISRSDEI